LLVGIDQQRPNLRRQTLDHPGRQRSPAQFLQALVHATHAPAEAAGEHDTGDLFARHQ
jgi:hypothetical protein